MNVFSKPINEVTTNKIRDNKETTKDRGREKVTNPDVVWSDYYKNNIDLKKFKIPQLKHIAKHNNLYVSGTKSILLLRISSFFQQTKAVVIIQTCFRKYIVSLFFKLRGGKKIDTNCVNDCDFYTMDPLNEIPFYDFVSYKDKQGFVYGFHLESLISLFENGGIFINPYNREKIDISIIRKLYSLIRINGILFKNNVKQPINNIVMLNENTVNNNNYFEINTTLIRRQTMIKLEEIKLRSLNTRIEEVFMEIDFLGNYTNSTWFSSLNKLNCIHFIHYLSDIYHSNVPFTVRSQICPFFNPFFHRVFEYPTNISNDEKHYHRALSIIENIVFSGGNIEFRRLGIIYILTSLTMVSLDARDALPWLYESTLF